VEEQLALADYVEKLTKEQTNHFTTRARLSNQLGNEMTAAKRQELVIEIDKLTARYNELAVKKEQVVESGKLPEADKPEPTVVIDRTYLREAQLKLRPKVSRAKARSAAKPDDAELASAYQVLKLELEQIDLQLQQLPNE
jgi:hypothetical protein